MSDAYHIDFLQFAHGMIISATKWPDDKATAQAPGQPNHCLWTLGHLAATYDWASGILDGKPSSLPESYQKSFAMGSVPTPDPSANPSIAEVRANFDRAYERFLNAAKALTPAQGKESLKEKTHGFAEDKFDLLYKMAWHDGWHLGQMTTLRKFLGLPPLIGG